MVALINIINFIHVEIILLPSMPPSMPPLLPLMPPSCHHRWHQNNYVVVHAFFIINDGFLSMIMSSLARVAFVWLTPDQPKGRVFIKYICVCVI